MSRRFLSKYNICKKLISPYKNLWGLYSKDYLRSVVNKRKKNATIFGEILNIKQSLKLFYSNLKEKSFEQYIKISIASHSITMDKIVSILECRLDSTLFRSCFVSSFQEARQVINNGFVTVNGLKTNFYSKKLKKGDIVKLSNKFTKINNFFDVVYSRSFLNHLEIDLNNFSFVFLWDIDLKSTYFPIDNNYLNILRFFR